MLRLVVLLLSSSMLAFVAVSAAPSGVLAQDDPAAQSAAETGTLEVQSSPPGAAVIVNGRRLGTTPLKLVVPSTASMRLRVELAGYASQEQSVAIAPGQTHSVALTLEAAPPAGESEAAGEAAGEAPQPE